MAKLFIGIALALMVATAALGFLAKGNIDKLQSTLKEKSSSLTKTQGDLQTSKNDLKKSNEERDAANTKAEETAKNLDQSKKDLDTAKGELDTAKTSVTGLTADLAKANEELEKLRKPAVAGGPSEDPRIAPLQAEVQTAKAEAAEAKKVLDLTIAQGKENEIKLAEATKRERDREKGITRKGLQGRILAVNGGWNFVVLSVGDKQGVMVNSPLLVVRGGTPVARLRITSVEPSTSIADVIPGSVARGVTVQPGDTVIFEGTRSITDDEKPSSTPESTPPAPALPPR
jgi:hypothetical protein